MLATWWPVARAAAPPDARRWPVTLVDVADRAGLREPSIYGGVDRKRFIIETNGAGAAFLDYDNDGWIDALVLSGTRLRQGTAWRRRRRRVSESVGGGSLHRVALQPHRNGKLALRLFSAAGLLEDLRE